ncbi:MAG: 50S ribosomal protein L32 [bacterium]|nr:50S ribosomal protein L32 [bacterium]
MAVPKKKMSRSRTRRRKAEAMKMRPVRTVTCDRCGSPKLPHRACTGPGGCGTYRDRTVVETYS